MYRTTDAPQRCPVCGGSSTTPPTEFDPSEGYSRVHFLRTDTRTRSGFIVDRASVCLDCGHIALSFSPKRLGELRSELPRLAAHQPD